MSDDLPKTVSMGRLEERLEAICDRTERIERLCERTDDRLRHLEERAAREEGQNYDARLTALAKRVHEIEKNGALRKADYAKVGGIMTAIATVAEILRRVIG